MEVEAEMGLPREKRACRQSGRRWHSAEDACLAEAWKKGRSAAEIASKLGRSPQAIRHRVHHLDLCRWKNQAGRRDGRAVSGLTEEELETLLDAFRRGAPIIDIAERLNRAESTVRSYLKKLGLKRPRVSRRRTKRRCLQCHRLFWSEGPHNRRCGPCKQTDNEDQILGYPAGVFWAA